MTEIESLDKARELLYVVQMCWMQDLNVPSDVAGTLINLLAHHARIFQDFETRQLIQDINLTSLETYRTRKSDKDIAERISALLSILNRRIEAANGR